MKISLLFLLLFFVKIVNAQNISVAGTWNPSVNANNITEAGLDYSSSYFVESAANQSTISLTLGGGFFNILFNTWRVDIRRSDILWHSSLVLEARRTSNGTGSILSSISGGSVYQPLNLSSASFFQGQGSYNGINIQYKISGMSVLTPVNTYATNVVFTLIDN